MNSYGVVLFHTTAAALRSEKVIERAGLTGKLIPTPRHLSSDCGIALRFGWPEREKVDMTLKQANVPFAGIHPFDVP